VTGPMRVVREGEVLRVAENRGVRSAPERGAFPMGIIMGGSFVLKSR